MTPPGIRDGHETSIKPVFELKFPGMTSDTIIGFIQQACQQGSEEGKQRKPILENQEEHFSWIHSILQNIFIKANTGFLS